MERIPEQIAELLLGLSSNKYILLLLVNIFLLLVGMFMDTGAAIILFAPILAPIMYEVGVHPVHFAIVVLLNLTLGLITPPVGVVLYSATAVGKRKFEDVVKSLIPFLIISFSVLAIVCLDSSLHVVITWNVRIPVSLEVRNESIDIIGEKFL